MRAHTYKHTECLKNFILKWPPRSLHLTPCDFFSVGLYEKTLLSPSLFSFEFWLALSLFSFIFWDYYYSYIILTSQIIACPVSWGCRIHWLHLCRGVRPPITSVLDMTLNNLMVRFQQYWSFGECGVPLHCHRSQVHSGPEW